MCPAHMLKSISVHYNASIARSYTGHLPTMKLDYAETYGKHGVKYFQDFRSRALEMSKNNISRGGYFPSIHTNGPDPAVASRTRLWDRWLQTPHYRLHNEDHDRREQLVDFCKVRYTPPLRHLRVLFYCRGTRHVLKLFPRSHKQIAYRRPVIV